MYLDLKKRNILDFDYVNKISHKEISDVRQDIDAMTLKECCTWLTWILRREYFYEGLF